MSDEYARPASSAAARLARPVRPARVALRSRLVPRGGSLPLLFACGIILTALLSFILAPPVLPPWSYLGTIMLLLALLGLNLSPVTHVSLEERGSRRAWLYVLPAGAFFLLALALSGGPYASPIPYIMFLLVGQAAWVLRLREALFYSVLMLLAFSALSWNLIGPTDTLQRMPDVTFVMLFTILFSWLTARYGEQTARAEALLRQLQAANAELTVARERARELAAAEERVQVAREIHDGLGHHLTVLNVQLQAAGKLLRRDLDRAEAAVALCREEAQAALREVRGSVAALRQTPLDGRSLDEALATLVHDFDRHATLEARFEQPGNPVRLPPAAALTLYRAAQEGLTNAQKYAAARQVIVSLEYLPESVRLVVQDDGSGEPPASYGRPEGSGFGLAGIRERAAQLGGTCVAAPQPGGGFRLELLLPYGAGDDDSRSAGR